MIIHNQVLCTCGFRAQIEEFCESARQPHRQSLPFASRGDLITRALVSVEKLHPSLPGGQIVTWVAIFSNVVTEATIAFPGRTPWMPLDVVDRVTTVQFAKNFVWIIILDSLLDSLFMDAIRTHTPINKLTNFSPIPTMRVRCLGNHCYYSDRNSYPKEFRPHRCHPFGRPSKHAGITWISLNFAARIS
jgi:hypothetical protein